MVLVIKAGLGQLQFSTKNDRIHRFKLGTPKEHTVYEVELVGIILMLHLFIMITHQIMRLTIIGLDNQVAICTLSNQSAKPSHYLLDLIVSAAEKLQERQDKIQNTSDFQKAKCQGSPLVARMKGVVNLQIHWVPGHKDFAPNEEADSHTKRVAEGDPSPSSLLLKPLRKPLPFSISALQQEERTKIQYKWL